jgi:hypothetical protein
MKFKKNSRFDVKTILSFHCENINIIHQDIKGFLAASL